MNREKYSDTTQSKETNEVNITPRFGRQVA
jgi:hypothetical protein